MDYLIKIFAIGGPLALAVMGFVVTDRPPTKPKIRYAWYAAFSAIAVLTVVFGIVDSKEQDAQLRTMLVGAKGDFPEITGIPVQDGTMRLFLSHAVGSNPLFDVTFSIGRNPPFEAITSRQWGTLLNGAWDTGINLKPAYYQINISARNGLFIESFAVQPCKGRLSQAFSIWNPFDGGHMLRRDVPDPDCFPDFAKEPESTAEALTYPLP
jgi:hypothetical protein